MNIETAPAASAPDAAALAMKNAYQLGIITRVTRRIVRCQSVRDICRVIEEAANQFNVSGCFRVICAGEQNSCRFGDGISRSHCLQLADIGECNHKLQSNDGYSVFKTDHLLLVLLTAGMSETDVDILKDNITILIDTIHFWLQNHERIVVKERESQAAKLVVADKMNGIAGTMLRFSQHLIENHRRLCHDLLSDLLVNLPSLGLEVDQEESMINLVGYANEEHGKLINLQIAHNEEMRIVMTEAAQLLANYVTEQEVSTHDCVEEEMVLF